MNPEMGDIFHSFSHMVVSSKIVQYDREFAYHRGVGAGLAHSFLVPCSLGTNLPKNKLGGQPSLGWILQTQTTLQTEFCVLWTKFVNCSNASVYMCCNAALISAQSNVTSSLKVTYREMLQLTWYTTFIRTYPRLSKAVWHKVVNLPKSL